MTREASSYDHVASRAHLSSCQSETGSSRPGEASRRRRSGRGRDRRCPSRTRGGAAGGATSDPRDCSGPSTDGLFPRKQGRHRSARRGRQRAALPSGPRRSERYRDALSPRRKGCSRTESGRRQLVHGMGHSLGRARQRAPMTGRGMPCRQEALPSSTAFSVPSSSATSFPRSSCTPTAAGCPPSRTGQLTAWS